RRRRVCVGVRRAALQLATGSRRCRWIFRLWMVYLGDIGCIVTGGRRPVGGQNMRGQGMTTHTLGGPGAGRTYDVRDGAEGPAPPLLLVGAPMGASGFASLAARFGDRTVVTYDPRGSERSKPANGVAETAVEVHADDLHRLIAAVTPALAASSIGGPVD